MKRDWSKYSKFWMGENPYTFNPKHIDMSDIVTILRLSAYKKAVANFVRIATGKNVPVLYNTGVQSRTNNKVVILSAKLEENVIDPAVGTALHEASHIVMSDFEFARHLPGIIEAGNNHTIVTQYPIDWESLYKVVDAVKNLTKSYDLENIWLKDRLHLIMNLVEDKRIDAWQYEKSPGYRGYYTALYERIFTTPLINKGLRSKNFRRTETWESYKFHIINITNSNIDLDALKGLREINNIFNLPTISRLTTTVDSFNVALKILDVVFRYITIEQEKQSKLQSALQPNMPKQYHEESEDDGKDDLDDKDVDDQNGGATEDDNLTGDDNFDESDTPQSDEDDNESKDNTESDVENSEHKSDMDNKKDGTPENSKTGENTESSDESSDESDESSNDEIGDDDESIKVDEKNDMLSPSQEKNIARDEKKQESFLNGDNKKQAISNDVNDMIRTCEDADVSIERVNSGILNDYGKITKIDCIVIRKVTHELIKTAKFWNLFESDESNSVVLQNIKSINAGINLGMRLGKKLQIRNDARTTKYSRLEDGRVDKKLLSSLGYGNEHIFYHTEIDKFNPVILHISVDASSSMAGEKWDKTMTTVVAICKAASMVSNLNVVVSFRSITATNGGPANTYRYSGILDDVFPLVAIAYDSRVDKFVKIKQVFKYIIPNGSTPEGLAFASILDEMVEGNPQKLDSYFLNLSDGEPYFISHNFSYSKQLAGKHTNSIVRMIRARGINVMSYFISDNLGADSEIFKLSYDKDARFINVSNIVELATTLNELFLRKG